MPPSHRTTLGPTAAFLRTALTLDAAECEEQVRAIVVEDPPNREIQLEAIYRRWLSLADAEEILRVSQSRLLRRAFFRAWCAVDEAAAMDQAKHREFTHERALFAVENDYPDFVAYLSAISSLRSPQSDALTALARRNPELARELAGAELPAGTKSLALAAVSRGLASHDPEGALAWLDALTVAADVSTRSRLAILSEWARTDLAATREALAGYPDLPPANLFHSGDYTPSFLTSPKKPTSQLDLARFNDPFLDVASLHEHLLGAEVDWSPHSFPYPAIGHDGWYSPDPEGAAREAAQLPAGDARDFIIKAICHNWAGHDPEAACQFAERHGVNSNYLERLRSTPTDEERAAALAAPEETFAPLFNREEGVDYSTLTELAEEWGGANPIAASRWLIEQDFGDDNPESVPVPIQMLLNNTLGYHWARQDPIGASEWVESLPEGPVRSRAWGAIRHSVNNYAPDLAFSLTAAWLEGPSRLRNLESCLRSVSSSIGYPAARSLLNSTELPPAEATALSEVLDAAIADPDQ